jgi:hypothetical protein
MNEFRLLDLKKRFPNTFLIQYLGRIDYILDGIRDMKDYSYMNDIHLLEYMDGFENGIIRFIIES